MQAAMDRLTAFLERRSRLVIALWVVAADRRRSPSPRSRPRTSPRAASPCPARAPTPSTRRSPTSRAPSARRSPSSSPAPRRRSVADVRAQIDRVDEVAAQLPHVELSDRAEAAAKREAGRVADRHRQPRRDAATRTRSPTWPSTCARSSGVGEGAATTAPRPTSSASRRCGPACRTSPRRTSRRPRPPASRSCC